MLSSDIDGPDADAAGRSEPAAPAQNEDWRRGRELLRAGQFGDALLFLERAAASVRAADPALRARALGHLGIAQYGSGQFEAAVRTFGQAIALSPGRARLHYDCANALFASDRLAEARAQYERALALDPDYDEARRALIVVDAEARLGGSGAAKDTGAAAVPSAVRRGAETSPADTAAPPAAWPIFEPTDENDKAAAGGDDQSATDDANQISILLARWQLARAATDVARRELAAREQAERDLLDALLTRFFAGPPHHP